MTATRARPTLLTSPNRNLLQLEIAAIYLHNRPIPFERLRNDLPILVSHFYQLRDEGKGSESARVKWKKKRGRKDSALNGIGIQKGRSQTGLEGITYHNMSWVEKKPWQLSLQRMQKRHSFSNVNCKLNSRWSIHHQIRTLMQNLIQWTNRSKLADNNQIWRRVATANDRHDIGMRKYPQFRVFVVEISWNPRGTFSNGQDFSGDFIALPFTLPCLTGWGLGDFGVEIELINVDTLMPGQGCVPGPGF